MTKLSKKISRETNRFVGKHPVIVTLAPAGSENEALIGLRLKGRRTTYVCALSDVFRMAALNYGLKMKKAKREARKNGISWCIAKKVFDAQNKI